MERTWILVGMMGAGKSAVGRELAVVSGRIFVDTDTLLQSRFGRPVSQIFQLYGEEAFRGHETSILRGLQPAASVLSTGGGIVMRPENWDEMRRLGVTIYLAADLKTLIDRLTVSKKRRPLLETENWEERAAQILESRRHLYEQADIHVKVSEEPVADVAASILKEIDRHG